jgi:hypothetical protein
LARFSLEIGDEIEKSADHQLDEKEECTLFDILKVERERDLLG